MVCVVVLSISFHSYIWFICIMRFVGFLVLLAKVVHKLKSVTIVIASKDIEKIAKLIISYDINYPKMLSNSSGSD